MSRSTAEEPARGASAPEPRGDDASPSALGGLAFNAVGLALAVTVALVLSARAGLWDWSGGSGAAGPPSAMDAAAFGTGAEMPGAVLAAGAGPAARFAPSPSPLLSPFATIPPREPLAGLPGARERFGPAFTIRHPTYLPADVAPFTVNWQPDADPRLRAAGRGELLSWFFSAEHGAVLVLAQGPGVGVWPLTARDDRAGRLRLTDGTEVVWFIGHPTGPSGAGPDEPEWTGTEITVGVPPTTGEGWYLSSPLISLAELVRIAESLRDTATE